MTKAQFAALLATLGTGFAAGSLLDFQANPPKATFVHTLRIETRDGGVPDVVIAYRTLVTPEDDGGVDLEDIGAANCTGGNTAPLRNYARTQCPPLLPDGGADALVQNIRVIEVRPDGDGKAAVSVYGDTFGTCYVNKPAALNTFIDSLTCTNPRFRSTGRPL